MALIGTPMWSDSAGYASPFSKVWNFRSLRLRSRGAKRLPIRANSPKTWSLAPPVSVKCSWMSRIVS